MGFVIVVEAGLLELLTSGDSPAIRFCNTQFVFDLLCHGYLAFLNVVVSELGRLNFKTVGILMIGCVGLLLFCFKTV